MIDSDWREGTEELRSQNERPPTRNSATAIPRIDFERGMLERKSIFADNTRFWSMVAIVGLHSAQSISTLVSDPISAHALGMVKGLEKFGTIGFFLISGFLLGERFETASALEFLSRRLKKIGAPWLFWVAVMTAGLMVAEWFRQRITSDADFISAHSIVANTLYSLTSTPFWFVPNLFLSICLLMAFRKHLRSLWLGYALWIVTGFYAANLYGEWIAVTHMTAIGGYVSVLWTGAYLSRNYAALESKLSHISVSWLISTVAVLWGLALAESQLIRLLGHSDGQNTLRLSNILFSFAFMLLIMKCGKATWPAFMDVRNHMFGIYLTHSLVLSAIVGLSWQAGPVGAFFRLHHGLSTALGSAILLPLAVFSISLAITRQLAQHRRLAWLIGDTSQSLPTSRDNKSRGPIVTMGIGRLEARQGL